MYELGNPTLWAQAQYMAGVSGILAEEALVALETLVEVFAEPPCWEGAPLHGKALVIA